MGLDELEWLSSSDWTAEGANNFPHIRKSLATLAENSSEALSAPTVDAPPRIKFKRLDKTARHIMQILDKEAVEHVRAQMEIPDIKPGYTVRLKGEVPENKRRVSTIVGTVIARRNAGLSTILDSEGWLQVLDDKKKVRRAKFYYLRDRMNSLKKR